MDDAEAMRLSEALNQMTSAVVALIEAKGMEAENNIRKSHGEALAYNEDSFNSVIAKHRLQGF